MSLGISSTQREQYLASTSASLDPSQILITTGLSKTVLTFKPKQNIFAQGSPAQAIYFITSGEVRLSVVSEHGREGVVAILGPRLFFGENCLANPPINTTSATAMTKTTVARIDKNTMRRVLHEKPELLDMFMGFLVERNKQVEADLLDHLFSSSEQRLARILLQLAGLENGEAEHCFIPKISQDILAARVGTTRSRISFFMNKFRKLGYVNYAVSSGSERPGLRIRSSLMSVIKE
jgi:CRP-like cAMP-binding protein